MSATASTELADLLTKRDQINRKLHSIIRKDASLFREVALTRNPKFAFYERVVVLLDEPEVFGKTGAVLGRAQGEDGTWWYAIFVSGPNTTWDIAESDLNSLGIVDKRENFYTGRSVRVRVSRSGRGSVAKARPKRRAKD